MLLFIINVEFSDWIPLINKNNKIFVINEDILNKYDKDEYKIVPICVKDYSYDHENNIFKNNQVNIDIFNNKAKFGEYMLLNFYKHIPDILYYNYDNITFMNNNINSIQKFIRKPNYGSAGYGIKIINYFTGTEKNCIIQKYIDHIQYYTGHFLILNGIIKIKIYFSSKHEYKNNIKTGAMINYTIINKLDINDNIFDKIFYKLNYNGFANADFIIKDDTIIIFEINPRPGGSLIKNIKIFDIFIDKLLESI